MSIRAGIAIVAAVLLLNCGRSARGYLEKGNSLFANGEYAEASLNYRKALQKDAKYGEAYHRLGLAELKQGHLPEAVQALSVAVQLLPNEAGPKVDLANLELDAYLQDPQRPKMVYDRLVSLSDELLNKNPNSSHAFKIKGYLALVEHRSQEALDLLRRADSSQPKQEDIVIGLMEALYQSNRAAEAEKLGLDSISADKTGRIYDALVRLYSAANRQADVENMLVRKTKEHPKESKYALQLAGYYARGRKTSEMMAVLEAMQKNSADFKDVHLEIGDFFVAFGRLSQALEQFQAGARSKPKDFRYQRRIAQVLVLDGKRDEALKVLNEIGKSNSAGADKDSRTLEATLLVQNSSSDKRQEGLKEFQSLVDKEPDDVLLRFLFSRALYEDGNVGGAKAQLIETITRAPGFLPARNALGELALQSGDLSEAIRNSDLALEVDRNNFRAQFNKASALLGLGNFEQASSIFNSLLSQDPNSMEVRLDLALIENRRKNFSAAEAAYKKILQASPDELRATLGLVQTYSDQHKLEKALSMLDQELQRTGGRAEIRSMLADTLMRAGKRDLAVEQYRQVAAANPNSVEPLLQIATALRANGDVTGAISTLQRAGSIQPGDARPPSILSSLLESLNRKDEAKLQCRRALSLRPDDAPLMNNLAFLLADTGDNLDEALKLARRAVEKAPNEAIFNDTLGWVCLKKGLNDEAVQIFRKLAGQHADDSIYSYHFGLALFQKGEMVEARLQLGRALELRPSKELKDRIADTLSQIN